jgi:regulatory protein
MSLINDEEFARWWIKQRIEFRPKGKKALYSELVKKGIDREIIETALSEIELDEIGLASEILKKKAYKWERLKGFDKKKKMSDFLARRGFMWETIKKAIEKIDQKDIKR